MMIPILSILISIIISRSNVVARLSPSNFGEEGLRIFHDTHRCHQLCKELALGLVNKLSHVGAWPKMVRNTTRFKMEEGEEGSKKERDEKAEEQLEYLMNAWQ